MNIAELFVNLGVKGSDKSVSDVAKLQKGLKDTASVSLEAKAAIIGAMYALERLFATSGQTGTQLTNFNALMGGGMVQTLQQYQYAARQVGVANEEVGGTFKNLTSTATKTLQGLSRPSGAAYIANATKTDLNPLLKAATEGHPEQLLLKLQEFAQHREINQGLMNEALKSFGLGDSMISALKRNAFRPEVLKQAPTYSDKEVQSLDKANIAWSNLGNKIEMAVGHFNAEHGGEIVKNISTIVDKVVKLAEKFDVLATKLELFKLITKAFEGWAEIFQGISDAIDKINDLKNPGGTPEQQKAEEERKSKLPPEQRLAEAAGGEKSIGAGTIAFFSEFWNLLKETAKNATIKTGNDIPKGTKGLPELKPGLSNSGPVRLQLVPSPTLGTAQRIATTPAVPPPTPPGAPSQHIEVNQTLQFQHEGKDARQTGDSVKKAVRDTWSTLNRGQGT